MRPIFSIAIYAVVACGVAAGFYAKGQKDERAAWNAALAKFLKADIEQHNTKAEAGHVVETAAVHHRARTDQAFARINLGVSNHALTDAAHRDCLDADGLRLWSAANAGAVADPVSPGNPDGSLPTAATTGDGQGAGPAGEPRRDSTAVSPLPQPAAGSGGLVESHGGNGQ